MWIPIQIPLYVDTSGSMSDEMIRSFVDEAKTIFATFNRRRAAFLKWQRKHKPERVRNRIRRASRRANRKD